MTEGEKEHRSLIHQHYQCRRRHFQCSDEGREKEESQPSVLINSGIPATTLLMMGERRPCDSWAVRKPRAISDGAWRTILNRFGTRKHKISRFERAEIPGLLYRMARAHPTLNSLVKKDMSAQRLTTKRHRNCKGIGRSRSSPPPSDGLLAGSARTPTIPRPVNEPSS